MPKYENYNYNGTILDKETNQLITYTNYNAYTTCNNNYSKARMVTINLLVQQQRYHSQVAVSVGMDECYVGKSLDVVSYLCMEQWAPSYAETCSQGVTTFHPWLAWGDAAPFQP